MKRVDCIYHWCEGGPLIFGLGDVIPRRMSVWRPPSRAQPTRAKAPVLIFAKNLVLFVGVSKDTMASVRAKRKTRQKLRFRRRGAVLAGGSRR